MKRTLLLLSALFVTAMSFSQGLYLIAWTNGTGMPDQSAYEQAYLAAIEAMPQIESIEIITDAADWAAFESIGFDDYDGVIICESISSSTAQYYGTMGFPKPLVLFEPWVLHKSGWEWYAQADGFTSADPWNVNDDVTMDEDRWTSVIETADHPIFTGFGLSNGDEVQFFKQAEDSSASGSYAMNLAGAVSDISDAATPLASNKQGITEGWAYTTNMWAVEENASTPRIFIHGYNAADLQVTTPEYIKLVKNATLWTLGLDITSAQQVATSSLSAFVNGASDLVISGVDGINNVTVYNLAGQAVARTNAATVSVSNLNKGVYIVKVTDSKGQLFSSKFTR